MSADYPRDMVGYGGRPPHPQWPGDARVAINIVFNYEEGSEANVLDGDPQAETSLNEVPAGRHGPGVRDLGGEGLFEYGSRAGFWRLLRICTERGVTPTIYACALALERNPPAASAIAEAACDLCCHGYRWEDHFAMSEAYERERIAMAVASLERTVGYRPLGWYCRYAPSGNTRRLLVEEGGFLYDSDTYNDDLPYWVRVGERPHLVIPYVLDANDLRYASRAPSWATGEHMFTYLRETFDMLYAEGATAPKMMTVGLHIRLAGRPGRALGLARFLDHALSHERVWFARRADIARHWHEVHPWRG